MPRRLLSAIGLAAALCALVAAPALAGGWAQATIDPATTPGDDDTPSVVVFGLLQHGVTPVDFGTVAISAFDAASGETVQAAAHAIGDGKWSAELQLHSGTTWQLTISHQDLLVEPAADMTLTTGPAAGSSGPSTANSGLLAVLVGLAFTPLLLGGLLVAGLARRPRARTSTGPAAQPK